ncbi:acetyl-CoA carboxylase biotin carboxyl carrier protein subunit [Flammeovirga kamogawensis]|uniref:Biotin/lipoyl-binding protein n=1 Tax=Flammeovirga kamogawensis TaxID=373891 RepID=A0ABX8GUB3_9BACT|nr:acetyl-CoA carboxylase biotin carboxyl carrier protein subunit [Flammeovirga kamogawensis]MBB6459743.1 biotin carboxyl carrier protein [Flammeovirga kamogawensis]QWG07198.1 biotin/lipoyl-binding protein [Flammeovirga kamogawensis]TRX69018.1 biotin/lipoyl-binding protein [Flammeovirga kamogawensis]
MLNITINNNQHSVIKDKQSLIIDNKTIDLKLKPTHNNVYTAIYNDKRFDVEIITADNNYKNACIKINGKKIEIEATTKLDDLLKQLGMGTATVSHENIVKAPMPGKVLELLCSEGSEVEKGDNLIILEAMKMENILKAPIKGVIKSIAATEGSSVEKGQVLIEIEE